MLKLWLNQYKGDKEYIARPEKYFDWEYEEAWFEDSFIKELVLDVDKSEVISANNIISPIFGSMGPKGLSGGTKALIMMYFDDTRVYNLSACGNNCTKWVLEMAQKKDIEARLGYCMNFRNYEFEMLIMNTNHKVSSQEEFVMELIDADNEAENEG